MTAQLGIAVAAVLLWTVVAVVAGGGLGFVLKALADRPVPPRPTAGPERLELGQREVDLLIERIEQHEYPR